MLIQKKAEVGFYNLKKSDLTFEALAEVWLHSLKNGIKESTYAHYSYTLHKYLLPVLSKMPVASFEESFLEQAMQQIITPIDSAHKPLGNSSARECLSMLRRICRYAAHLRIWRLCNGQCTAEFSGWYDPDAVLFSYKAMGQTLRPCKK